jgi:hypothetical protein
MSFPPWLLFLRLRRQRLLLLLPLRLRLLLLRLLLLRLLLWRLAGPACEDHGVQVSRSISDLNSCRLEGRREALAPLVTRWRKCMRRQDELESRRCARLVVLNDRFVDTASATYICAESSIPGSAVNPDLT